MNRTALDDALSAFASELSAAIAAQFPGASHAPIAFEAPRRPEFGDFATNVAFELTKVARQSPQQIASRLVEAILANAPQVGKAFSEVVATAGFINVRATAVLWQRVLEQILHEGSAFGESPAGGEKISLEFGSANPTGPLVVVQGRTCSIGATLANAFRYCGYDVFVEWIINDAGRQLEMLGRSLYARYRQIFQPDYPLPEDGYPGTYLVPIAQQIAKNENDRWLREPEEQWLPLFSKIGRDELVAEQRRTIERFGVDFDLWQSERELHETGLVQAGIARLKEDGATYEQDGALYFRATEYGDDKDRVLVRSDGRPTYLAADVAYHFAKLQRSDRAIDILGPDHHGYIGRLKGLAEALGYSRDHLDVLIAQQITLMRGPEQVSMSKRAGEIVTLDEIIDEVGVDAARFFFVLLAPESPLTFDLELAKAQTNDNPVYYVQYGHARIASVFKNAEPSEVEAATKGQALDPLSQPSELALMRRLAELPKAVRNAVDHLAPHRLPRYARDVASDFHQFYTECKILTDDRDLRLARLSLCVATQSVLARTLALCGVTAPESM